MKHIEFNLGFVCNNNCKFCTSHSENKNGKFITQENAMKIIEEYKKKGYDSIGFVGGEPTIHPKIITLIRNAREAGFKHIAITTNGRRFSDKKFLLNAIKAGLNRVSFSIHSHLPKTEDDLTSVKGGFKQKLSALENILYLSKAGFINEKNVTIISVLNKENYGTIIDSLGFFEGLGFSNFRVNFVRPTPFAIKNRIVPTYSEIKNTLFQIIKFTKKKDVFLKFDGIPPCVFGEHFEERYVPKQEQDIDECILNENDGTRRISFVKQKKDKLNVKLNKCNCCKHSGSCFGVYKHYIILYGNEEFEK
ncbi:radical SAM protein [Candidatus Woesearchaeota archaeon]|nr:radical SAM protein [Candidatus Woesearchaeota archaeon]